MNKRADITVPPETLRTFIADVLSAGGLPFADARTVAELMVEADLHGHDGHGVFRLPHYMRRMKAGGFNLSPDIRIDHSMGSVARFHGDDAMGHLVVKRMVEEAIRLAGVHGVSWVGCHHSNHAGAAGVYAMMPVREDMIGIYMAVGSSNHMAPWGGADLLLSTNPIAMGIPGGDGGPMLLDMATSNAAYGKVKLAAQRGEMMPEGWMIDADGNPLTDPNKAAGGSLLPIGGPKGYGLALMVGLLAGTLNTAAMGANLVDFTKDDASPTNTGQCICVVNLAAMSDPAAFKAEVDRVRAEMKGSRLRPGFDEIRIPGDRALASREVRLREGVPISAALLDSLRPASEAAGVAPLEARI